MDSSRRLEGPTAEPLHGNHGQGKGRKGAREVSRSARRRRTPSCACGRMAGIHQVAKQARPGTVNAEREAKRLSCIRPMDGRRAS